jgi:NADH dehydrogenase
MLGNQPMDIQAKQRVIIVGGGFGGLAAAKALAAAPVELLVIDRRNHHVFQPLLYQVATASLSPAQIAAPIRSILARQANCEVVLAEITAVDLKEKQLRFSNRVVGYDYLIVATGCRHDYFGNTEWAKLAPGLKDIEDALELRKRILMAFETAEYEPNDLDRNAVLTFAIVGGGATGVELAGAIQEIAGKTLPLDYRHIDTRTTRVLLFEGGSRLLDSFDVRLSRIAKRDLESMGVEVRLKSRVTKITPEGLWIGDEFIGVKNIFWAAGVKGSPLGVSLGAALDRVGRVIVNADLTIAGEPNVFVVGDMAAAQCGRTGKGIPGVAQAAIQMGRFAGETIAGEVGAEKRNTRKAFIYQDKGSMAVIGKAKAVAQVGGMKIGGFLAWLIWGGIHIAFLVGFRNRMQVMLSWLWAWFTNSRDARLILGAIKFDVKIPCLVQLKASSGSE